MIIGIPKESINGENRVGLSPMGAKKLLKNVDKVIVASNAGRGCQYENEHYQAAECEIIADNEEVFARADTIIKIKEPKGNELHWLREGQSIFSFLHLASNRELFEIFLEKNITSFAYESVVQDGIFPALVAMGKIAGVLSVNIGSYFTMKHQGGKGKLLYGLDGHRDRGTVVVIGCGNVGRAAAKFAADSGANTIVLDISKNSFALLEEHPFIEKLELTPQTLEATLKKADLVIGSVLLPDRAPPKVIRSEHLAYLQPGTVLVDVAIDQGGCFEDIEATSHKNPCINKHGLRWLAIPNLPGAVPLTSSSHLEAVVLPWIEAISSSADIESALSNSQVFRSGINTYAGSCTNAGLSLQFEEKLVDLEQMIIAKIDS